MLTALLAAALVWAIGATALLAVAVGGNQDLAAELRNQRAENRRLRAAVNGGDLLPDDGTGTPLATVIEGRFR